MNNIYDNEKFKYSLTSEEKEKILECMKKEFEITYFLMVEETDNDIKIVFKNSNHTEKYVWESLWNCKPPLINIKYIITNFFRNSFENSQTDKLCKQIHNTKI